MKLSSHISSFCAFILLVAVLASAVIEDHVKRRFKRVIGGDATRNDEDTPFLVSMKGTVTKSGWWFATSKTYVYCGGSVVNKRWVLLAAHCFDNNNGNNMRTPSKWKIRVGSRKRTHTTIDHIGDFFGNIFQNRDWMDFEFDATRIVIHDGYNPNEFWKNDLALVKVDEDIPMFDQIQPISLPSENTLAWPEDNNQCKLAGWGCTSAGGAGAARVLQVTLPKVNDDQCVAQWNINKDLVLCAGYHYKSKGICPGDSGSPLLCKNGDKWVQAGIASFTSRSIPAERPGAFTRISSHLDWIEMVVKG